jgi:hypothetical protein
MNYTPFSDILLKAALHFDHGELLIEGNRSEVHQCGCAYLAISLLISVKHAMQNCPQSRKTLLVFYLEGGEHLLFSPSAAIKCDYISALSPKGFD